MASSTTNTDLVRIDTADSVAVITLNRPEVRNALSADLMLEIYKAVGDCEASDAVQVMILTGSDPAFCAGLDLKDLASGKLAKAFAKISESAGLAEIEARTSTASNSTAASPAAAADADLGLPSPFPAHRKLLIGAINGVAVTGGLELALACDFLVASDRAGFADTHARVGIMPAWGLTVLLPQAVGVRRAREMSVTGNYVDAATALDWGLVNHVVSHAELLPFCIKLAADVCSNDAAAVKRLLQTYAEGSLVTVAQAWGVEADAGRAWYKDGGGDLDEVERRRQGIIERGRSQAD